MKAYIDTSVLAAYYCPEALSPLAQSKLTSLQVPIISRLVDLEFCSAVSLKVRTGQLDPTAANRVLSLFEVHKSAGAYQWREVGPAEYQLARQWVSRLTTPLRTLDSLHLAVAFTNGISLLTADFKLSRVANELGVTYQFLASP
ncbi:MAG: type II toxin-antitoxin system VapC family toxin [Candidatus Eremiobacteraeota bacterium]|nr:type II toxin-antitoxin system VapC family toxin [Candidatus Eremiobacteraeota bacterium]MCW5867565.1 type II toxin-antitoxin system VapC family toxin [Candidatus Eremiobacteraeota bacterium]